MGRRVCDRSRLASLPRFALLQILHHLLQAADDRVDDIGHLIEGVVGEIWRTAPTAPGSSSGCGPPLPPSSSALASFCRRLLFSRVRRSTFLLRRPRIVGDALAGRWSASPGRRHRASRRPGARSRPRQWSTSAAGGSTASQASHRTDRTKARAMALPSWRDLFLDRVSSCAHMAVRANFSQSSTTGRGLTQNLPQTARGCRPPFGRRSRPRRRTSRFGPIEQGIYLRQGTGWLRKYVGQRASLRGAAAAISAPEDSVEILLRRLIRRIEESERR